MFVMSYCISANTSDASSLIEPTATRQRRVMRLSWHHSKHSIEIFEWEAISSNEHPFEISLVIIHHRLFLSTGAEVNTNSFTGQTRWNQQSFGLKALTLESRAIEFDFELWIKWTKSHAITNFAHQENQSFSVTTFARSRYCFQQCNYGLIARLLATQIGVIWHSM